MEAYLNEYANYSQMNGINYNTAQSLYPSSSYSFSNYSEYNAYPTISYSNNVNFNNINAINAFPPVETSFNTFEASNNSNINNDNYVLLQGWMINELGLKDIEVTVYAVIYGASHNEGQYYDGNIVYISEWLSVDNDTVLRTIKSLIEKGLIGVNSCYDSRGKHNIYYVKNILGRKQ